LSRTVLRSSTVSDFDLQEFNKSLDWHTGYPLPDGRYVGWSETEVKNGHARFEPGTDFRIQAVIDHFQPNGKAILELGSCEGVLTVQLARICTKVVAIEVRPQNVTNALTRLYLHGVSNFEMHLMDARDVDEKIGRYDVLFHSGLLYHLPNPAEHLYKVSRVSDALLLCTQYGNLSGFFEPTQVEFGGKSYAGYIYNETGWSEPLAGVEDYAVWLEREALFELVKDVGFSKIEVIQDDQNIEIEAGDRKYVGHRICLVATRKPAGWRRFFSFG
jgi:hypothetical protein